MPIFSSSPLALASIANAITGLRHLGHAQRDLRVLGREHVARARLLQLRHGADVARAELVRVLGVLALRHQQLADALLDVRPAVVHVASRGSITPW